MQQVHEVCNYAAVSASGNVMARSGALIGIFVANGSGTITIYDTASTETSRKVVDAFSVNPGMFYPLPFVVSKGIYIVISGGTMNITVGLQAD